MNIALNPKYAIRNGKSSSFICLVDQTREDQINLIPAVTQVPPLYGYILSKCDGRDLNEISEDIFAEIGIKPNLASCLSKLINNEKMQELKTANGRAVFPPFILIENKKEQTPSLQKKNRIYYDESFHPLNVFVPSRPTVPIDITIMLTSKCQTDCIYCYADRSRKIDFELDKIMALLDECNEIGVINVSLSGGDIFAYKDWKKVMKKMYDYQYSSFISTKIPLTLEDIRFLKEIGIEEIQFSLDSADPQELKKILKVDHKYIDRVKEMLRSCESNNIKVNIKTILTKYNSIIDNIDVLYKTIREFNINSWSILPVFYSTYKGSFEDYRPSLSALNDIANYITRVKNEAGFIIQARILSEKIKKPVCYSDTGEFVTKNTGCVVAAYSLSLNVYGKVTVCEMLYNEGEFHFGNVHKQTIKEIWESEKIMDFYNFSIQGLPRNEENPCTTCADFKLCKVGNVKRVCIVDVVRAYGPEKWDYPDPRCPRAPECDKSILML